MKRFAKASVGKVAWDDFGRVQKSYEDSMIRDANEAGYVDPHAEEDEFRPDAEVFILADEAERFFPLDYKGKGIEGRLLVWFTGSTETPEKIRIQEVLGPNADTGSTDPDQLESLSISPEASAFLQQEVWKQKNQPRNSSGVGQGDGAEYLSGSPQS
jgi:hypothetical protein